MNANIANIIHRALEGEATAQDLQTLKAWTEESGDNYRDFLYEKENWHATHRLQIGSTALQSARQRLMRLILGDKAAHADDDMRRHRIWKWVAAAAAVAAIAIIMTTSYFHKSTPTQEQPMTETITKPTIRGSLILPSGKKIDLAQTAQTTNHADEEIDGVVNSDGLIDFSDAKAALDEKMTVSVPVSGYYKVALSDGSTVTLNSASSLIFPPRFSGQYRQVFLIGEAYFSVTKDTQRQFIVSTQSGMDIVVRGTQFNVNAYNPHEVRATLVSGSIAARTKGKETAVRPGQQIAFSQATGAITVKSVDTYFDTAWKDGKLVFDNESIVEIMSRIANWYNLRVEYANEGVKKQTFTGSISRTSEFGDILNLIEQTTDIHFTVRGNTVTVK